MSDLKHAGIVASRRGSEGGYVLIKDVQDLHVGDVLRAVQGQLLIGPESQPAGRARQRVGDAAFAQYWQKIDQAMLSLSAETSFGDLLDAERDQAPPVLDYSI